MNVELKEPVSTQEPTSIEVVEAGPHDADLVSVMVYELLLEANVGGVNGHKISDVEINETCHMLFEENTQFSALLAFAHFEDSRTRKPVGVMTITETVALYAKGRFGQIMEFFVDPNFRSQRIGVQMMEAAQNKGREKGWTCLEVNAPDIIGGKRAVGFYTREGFHTMGPTMKLDLS